MDFSIPHLQASFLKTTVSAVIAIITIGIGGSRIVRAEFGPRALAPLRDLVDDADLIIVGSVVHLAQDKDRMRLISTIDVIDVVKDARPKTDVSKEKTSRQITVIQQFPFSDLSAIMVPQGKDLLFLRAISSDAARPDNVDPSSTYFISHDWQGAFNLFDPLEDKRREEAKKGGIKNPRRPLELCLEHQYAIKSPLEYLDAVRRYYKILGLGGKDRESGLVNLINSEQRVLEESGLVELEKIGIHVEKKGGRYKIVPAGKEAP